MQRLTVTISLAIILLLAAACNRGAGDAGRVIKSGPAENNLTATLSNKDGVLRHGPTDFTLSFTDAAGKPVEVGAVALTFHMPSMGTMPAMNDAATFTTTNTPGVYHGTAKIERVGEWHAQITYDGPVGRGQATLIVTAQ